MTKILFITVILMGLTSPAHADNYKFLLSQPKNEQYRIFQTSVNSAGKSCSKITGDLFMGSDREENGYWSLSCAGGENYVLQIMNDSTGRTKVMECELMAMIGIKCWKKL